MDQTRSEDARPKGEGKCANGTCRELVKNGLPPLEHNALHDWPAAAKGSEGWEKDLFKDVIGGFKIPKRIRKHIEERVNWMLYKARSEGEREGKRKVVEAVEAIVPTVIDPDMTAAGDKIIDAAGSV